MAGPCAKCFVENIISKQGDSGSGVIIGFGTKVDLTNNITIVAFHPSSQRF